MDRPREFAVQFSASVFAVWLLTDVSVYAIEVSAGAPTRARCARGDRAEVVAQSVVDWRVVEITGGRVVVVASKVKLVAKLLFRNALGESRTVVVMHRRHVYVEALAFGVDRDETVGDAVRAREDRCKIYIG